MKIMDTKQHISSLPVVNPSSLPHYFLSHASFLGIAARCCKPLRLIKGDLWFARYYALSCGIKKYEVSRNAWTCGLSREEDKLQNKVWNEEKLPKKTPDSQVAAHFREAVIFNISWGFVVLNPE